MTFFLQVNYAKILGTRLDRFKVKRESPFLAAGRCPVCGDSLKSKTKTRFSIYEKDSSLNVGCYNCGLSTTLVNFLKLHYKQLFDEYIFDKFKNNSPKHVITTTVIKVEPKPPDKLKFDLPLVSSLSDDHIAKQYVKLRGLPDYPFYFADKFFNFSKQYNAELTNGKTDECRLVIPFFDPKGNIFAYQGRDLVGKSKLKYITIQIDKKIPKIFGFDRLDINKEILIVEGPLDSLFLPNCVASVNASLVSTADKLLHGINKTQTDVVLIFDNEPRSAEIVAQYKKAIDSGYKIVLWPREVNGIKDINEMILSGIDPLKVIKKNTFQGLTAKLQFTKWKKI
jgi:transcription elongation factor Elf1